MFTSSDSECIIQSISRNPDDKNLEKDGKPNWEARISSFMKLAEGAYSCVLLTKEAIFAWRDPCGLRPLCLGSVKYDKQSTSLTASLSESFGHLENQGWIVSSESCALRTVGAELIRDVRPGEIIRIDDNGISSVFNYIPSLTTTIPKHSFCIFEYVYFSRPDSIVEGRLVHSVRQNLGRNLALESPVLGGQVVVGVPDSSTPIAIGYAQASNLPFTEGLTKNRYIARTFIQPDQNLRIANVELKYNTLGANLKGKIVILVDDSIVRGTTCAQLVKLLKNAGAKEVHLRIGSPPVKYPCFMGIDMKTGNELIAHQYNLDEIKQYLGADSLAYLSHDGMIQSVIDANSNLENDKNAIKDFCSACFTGEYPLSVESW